MLCQQFNADYITPLCQQQTICISELITRAAKHLYKSHMQGVDSRNVASAISHFLNCLLGSFPTPNPGVTLDEVSV